ncbi:oxidoreductase domain protein [Pseudopedobacter saltans DSM 12145]|uniref:Oxidoreductase domain protein n=1 Tax=Pseudopedobacter saltans (strain ATCC 51119 / DSM 12145 / JCM 21818 / CCUG 39354 / LMG 10337 / NBRC 100064 / NCIMB 13643) TaxID=762903 RepID=F0S8N0_PSESL|nr:Gfo/Idh/MocA family oxidoreductase [Pseudopedobacter saltans]ADY51314.1 oxidoreductase domain protein [Pseudopedobacter saltans DSM 12145]
MSIDKLNRRKFLKTATIAGAVVTAPSLISNNLFANQIKGKRVGIIGLDTSHSVAFTKELNSDKSEYLGYRVVAAYPQGSKDIKTSVDRISGFTEDVKKHGVEIVSSIEDLLKKVDVVLLETNDGRLHLEQALPVLKAKKRMFIDKPIAASYKDAKQIFETAKKYDTPIFSSSSLRYIEGMKEIKGGSIGKIIGADTYSPAVLEPTHPDFFWYGIHGVEMLFAVMGTGCKSVTRVFTEGSDVAVGTWDDGRIGVFRGIRDGKKDFGGTVIGEKSVASFGKFLGYNPLLAEIIKFFETGVVPFDTKETLEICAFMEAADESKKNGGKPVLISSIVNK